MIEEHAPALGSPTGAGRAGRAVAAARSVVLSRSGLAHGLQSTAAAFALLAVNLVNGILAARSLKPAGRGELSALLIWPQTFAYLASLGLPGALVYHVRRSPSEASRLYSATCLIGLAQGGVAGLVGFLVVPHLLGGAASGVVIEAQLVMLFAPVLLLGLYGIGMLQARLEIGLAGLAALAPSVATLGLFATLIAADRMSPMSATLATLAPIAVVTAIVWARLVNIHGFVVRGLRSAVRPLMSFGLRSYPLDIVATLSVVIDQALVAVLLGATPLGLYVVALRGSRLLGLAANAVTPVLFARASGRSARDAAEAAGRVLRVATTVSVLGAVVLIAFAPQILTLVYGGAFASASTAMRVLAVEVVISSAALILTQTFHAVNRPGFVSALESISLVLLVGLIWALSGPFGLTGVALALLIASIGRLLAVAVSYRRILGVGLPRPTIGRADLAWLRESLSPGRSATPAKADKAPPPPE